jgi:dTDP-4-dehydrorhamnose 3,5-epimerase
MAFVFKSEKIDGVWLVSPTLKEDARGWFAEIFCDKWFPAINWEGKIQQNESFSKKDVLRGLHYHHLQIDCWRLVEGEILVGLFDLRQGSPTYGKGTMIEMNAMNRERDPRRMGLVIPPGVAHGFVVKSETALLSYLTNQHYNPDNPDEHGLFWNDPALGLNWGIEYPILSEKDAQNPFLKDISEENLPK